MPNEIVMEILGDFLNKLEEGVAVTTELSAEPQAPPPGQGSAIEQLVD